MSTPYLSAEYRPTYDPDSPIGLRRRGQEPTGRPEIDVWRDTGSVSMMSVADAVALRDSLTTAIEAATPKQEAVKAARTCWTCQWAQGPKCSRLTWPDGMIAWLTENTDPATEMPKPTATPCPGFENKP